jgi:chitodextrinase
MKHNVFYFVTQGETEPTQTDIWAYRYKGAGSNPDVTPAGVPTNVTAQTVSSSQINLSWSASSDPQSGIKSYGIYRNNTLVANTGATSYSDIGLSAGTTYSYQITAINGEGLESARSAAVSATTGPASPVPDTTPASVPANVTAQPVSSSQIILNWSASSDPQSGVTGYWLYRDNILLTTITSTVFNDIGLAPATTYDYQVSAINGEGLESARSAVVSATTTTATTLPDKLFEDGFEDN